MKIKQKFKNLDIRFDISNFETALIKEEAQDAGRGSRNMKMKAAALNSGLYQTYQEDQQKRNDNISIFKD